MSSDRSTDRHRREGVDRYVLVKRQRRVEVDIHVDLLRALVEPSPAVQRLYDPARWFCDVSLHRWCMGLPELRARCARAASHPELGGGHALHHHATNRVVGCSRCNSLAPLLPATTTSSMTRHANGRRRSVLTRLSPWRRGRLMEAAPVAPGHRPAQSGQHVLHERHDAAARPRRLPLPPRLPQGERHLEIGAVGIATGDEHVAAACRARRNPPPSSSLRPCTQVGLPPARVPRAEAQPCLSFLTHCCPCRLLSCLQSCACCVRAAPSAANARPVGLGASAFLFPPYVQPPPIPLPRPSDDRAWRGRRRVVHSTLWKCQLTRCHGCGRVSCSERTHGLAISLPEDERQEVDLSPTASLATRPSRAASAREEARRDALVYRCGAAASAAADAQAHALASDGALSRLPAVPFRLSCRSDAFGAGRSTCRSR